MGCRSYSLYAILVCFCGVLLNSHRILLAQLNMNSLVNKTNPKTIKDALKSLPTGSKALDSDYAETMKRIENSDPDRRELAKRTSMWIVYAQRPLTVDEVQHALAIELGESDLDRDNLDDVEEIVSVCAGLVIVNRQNLRLVHYTTQEYFSRTGLDHFRTHNRILHQIASHAFFSIYSQEPSAATLLKILGNSNCVLAALNA